MRLLIVGLIGAVCGDAVASQPNIILIMADDLGYETIGANGGTSYRTPVLDTLATGGARFEHCYVQPLCTPTRVQLMTGASNARNYLTFGQMDPKLTTFGNLFRDAGYATCITGKWQLGNDPELPRTFGFEEHCLWQHMRRPPRYANPGLEINGIEKDYTNGEYGPDLVNAYALDFIARHKDQPFFLYYPMILTHAPYQPTPGSRSWDPTARGEGVNTGSEHFGEMVEYMDKLVGRVVAKLELLELRQNTLLVFLGDNGTGGGTRSRMGDRAVVGGKGRTTAAGMHVPLIVNWLGTIEAGTVCGDLIDSTDFLPTICDAAGIAIPSTLTIDGRSFLPQLRGEQGRPRQWIYCWYSPRMEPLQEFAFDQRYKLHRDGRFLEISERGEETLLPEAAADSGEAAAAAGMLRAALGQFADVRPAHLPKPGEKPAAKPKKNQRKEQK
jgi:arylsulfatase A